jgi:magnesium-transporting ATPase (P-type)
MTVRPERSAGAVNYLESNERLMPGYVRAGGLTTVPDHVGFGEDVEKDLRPLGLVALHDPLRPAVPTAVREARAAGVTVRILTGDHPRTATAIGRALGLPPETVFARVTP